MADNLDDEIDGVSNNDDIINDDSSNGSLTHDEGAALEELFANSEYDDHDEGEAIDDINVDDMLQDADGLEVPDDLTDVQASGNTEDDDPGFSLDDLFLDDLMLNDNDDLPDTQMLNTGEADNAGLEEEDIDLMDLLTGGFDSIEETEDDSPDNSQIMDNTAHEIHQMDSGKNQVLVDNDILSIDNLEESGESMGDVFSDALSALSSEQEPDSIIPETPDLPKKTTRVKKKDKNKKTGKLNNLFGNVVDEKEIAKAQQEKEAALQAEKKKETDEEKKKEHEELKQKKKAENKDKKVKAKEEKLQQKLTKKQAKKEAKELKELEEEAEIEGRINKVGASIVFVVLFIMAALIFLGTRIFSYNNSISNAESYLKKGQYIESYNELLGVDLKEEDKVLYQKVVTVMYVYKQLEAYDIYYQESRYPEALDSLLKGVREYEKNMPEAIKLDVSSDLESVKSQIITELETEYGITEEMAKEINQISDSTEYSQRVYDLSQNLANNYF